MFNISFNEERRCHGIGHWADRDCIGTSRKRTHHRRRQEGSWILLPAIQGWGNAAWELDSRGGEAALSAVQC